MEKNVGYLGGFKGVGWGEGEGYGVWGLGCI